MAPRPTKAEIELIGEVPLFSLTGKKQLQKIAKEFKTRNVAEGEQITVQGEYGREFYVVVSGAHVVRSTAARSVSSAVAPSSGNCRSSPAARAVRQ